LVALVAKIEASHPLCEEEELARPSETRLPACLCVEATSMAELAPIESATTHQCFKPNAGAASECEVCQGGDP
jgi:hypothetical protein